MACLPPGALCASHSMSPPPSVLLPPYPTRQLTLHNDLPSDWPNVHPGLSIHWHGWDMRGYPCECMVAGALWWGGYGLWGLHAVDCKRLQRSCAPPGLLGAWAK